MPVEDLVILRAMDGTADVSMGQKNGELPRGSCVEPGVGAGRR